MDLRSLFIIMIFTLNFSTFALRDCRDISDIEVMNDIADYKYQYHEGKTILTSRAIIKRPLVRQWSNVSAELYEVYYKYNKKALNVTSVNIKYFFNKKELYSKDYKMKKYSKNILKIDKFKFQDGVLDPKFRKGMQVYTFKKDGRDFCAIDVLHAYATEY